MPSSSSDNAWRKHDNLEHLWSEDDACRGDDSRERIEGAWQRLFAESYPGQKSQLATEDLGDCFLHLHPHGRIAEYSCEGEAIYRLKTTVELAVVPEPKVDEQIDEEISEISEAVVDTLEHADTVEDDEKTYRYGDLWLSADQRDLVEDTLKAIDAGERILVLKGAAGTGKTTCAIALTAELFDRGWRVKYMAPTGKAADKLSKTVGYPATTIHSAMFKQVMTTEDGVPIFSDPKLITDSSKVAIICDEASMVGSRIYKQMLTHIGPGIIIFIGDNEQLSPVADTWGPDFDNPTAELTKIHRQAQHSPIVTVATDLINGIPLPKVRLGTEYIRDDQTYTLDVAARWLARELGNGEDAILLCFGNKTRKKLNKLVRMHLGYRQRGALVEGEQLVVLRNNRVVGRMNGETLLAESIRPMPPMGGGKDQGVVLIRSGHSGMLTRPDLIGIDGREFEIEVKLAERDYPQKRLWTQFDYGYCLTVHKVQGSEYQKVLFVIDNTMRYMTKQGLMSIAEARRLCYTAITRARSQVIVMDAR